MPRQDGIDAAERIRVLEEALRECVDQIADDTKPAAKKARAVLRSQSMKLWLLRGDK